MAFQSTKAITDSLLTDNQKKAMSTITAFKGMFPIINKKTISKENHVSLFDYLKMFTEQVLGPAFLELMLQDFINQVFDPGTDKLESAIIKSLAKSLDANGKQIVSGQKNEDWLNSNIKPGLHTSFSVTKGYIAKQIIAMIFGPKEKMVNNDPSINNNFEKNTDNLLYAAGCADEAFSVTNTNGTPQGDLEFNTVKLRERLAKGEMIFTISCQDVKIKLPESVFKDMEDSITQKTVPNIGARMFTSVNNFVGQETQRINSQENVNSIKKSMQQIFIEKILGLITAAVQPYVNDIFNKISEKTGNKIDPKEIVLAPCQLQKANAQDDEKKNKFAFTLINIIYALLCTIILTTLLREAKKIIQNALAKKALNKAQRQSKLMQRISSFLSSVQSGASSVLQSASKVKEKLNAISDISNFNNIV